MAGEPTLRRGADDREWVLYMQGRLAHHGYSPGSIDGDFGQRTETEVRQFQTDHGLRSDGVVGPITWGELEQEPAYSSESIERPGEESQDVSQIDPSEAQALAEQIAAAFNITSEAQAFAEQIAASVGITTGSDAELQSAIEELGSFAAVKAKCGHRCDLTFTYIGEIFVLHDCGDGTCPSCPPGLGNLIVRHWCSYVSVASQHAAIVLHLVFGAKVGPFLVP